MSSLQEILDRAIARNGPDGFMIQQLKNQIMAEKKINLLNKCTLEA